MQLKKVLDVVLLSHDWDVQVNGTREQLIQFFSKKFKTDSRAVGETTWKSIYFMCPTFPNGIHKYSLIGFNGTILEANSKSTIKLEARFGQPFIWIYILAALSFPVCYAFDINDARENLNFFGSHLLNIILPPSFVWFVVMIYYQFKLAHGKEFIRNAIKEFQSQS